MPEPATINDLLNKKELDSPAEQNSAAQKLREGRRGGGGAGKNIGQPANLGGGLDNELMAGRQLREEQNKDRMERDKGEEKGKEPKNGNENKGDRVSQLKERAKLKKETEEKKEEVATPATQATSGLLRQAWIHLLDTWGATLLYIDLHVFLQKVLGEKLFCRLGGEWFPKAGKATKEKIGLAESMGCCLLNLVFFYIIIVILTMIFLMLDIIKNPLSYVWEMLTSGK